MSEVIPAATLVLFRDAATGPPELLMVERDAAMAFAGGAMVFPGGRIDPADRTLAATLAGDPDDLAARIAAIRETLEEVGVAVALAPPPAPDQFASLRTGLHAGAPLGDLLAVQGLEVTPERLVAFARWRPDHPGRVFDTRFYLARFPEDGPAATVDRTENVRLVWTSAAAALADADAGHMRIIYPTRRNLERLALFSSFDDAVAQAIAHPVEIVTPWREVIDGVDHLCIPADLGYPVTREPIATAQRG